jgi:hypothetical protein
VRLIPLARDGNEKQPNATKTNLISSGNSVSWSFDNKCLEVFK